MSKNYLRNGAKHYREDSDLSAELAKKAIAMNMHPLEAIYKRFVVGVNYIGDQFE